MNNTTLDDQLVGAAGRLDGATAGLTVPTAPRPSAPVGRLAAAAACVLAVVGGLVAISVRDHHSQRPVDYPPGLLDGANGPEITLTEVPDGDADPDTWKLEATPGGGFVTQVLQDGGMATSVAGADATAPPDTAVPGTAAAERETRNGGTADTVPSGQPFGPALCTSIADGSGYCFQERGGQLGLFLGARGPSGQALVHDLPAGTFAVTFQSGAVRYWERPLHGVALFPYHADASPTATFNAIDAHGAVIAGDSATNDTMSAEEVVAATVTAPTGKTLAGGWFADTTPNTALGGEVVRLEGRTAPLGFAGPFTDQAYVVGSGSSPQWVDVVTVRTADVGAVTGRLAGAAGGSVRWTSEVSPGVTVLIWAGDGVPASEIDRAAASLRQRDPSPDLTIDLGRPFSFTGPVVYGFVGSSAARQALTSNVLATTGDGRQVIGTSDDVGDVDVEVELGSAITNGVRVGPHVPDMKRLPMVGDHVFRGLWAVPDGTTGIRLTLDDGTVVTPEVIDLGTVADADLLLIATDHGDHLVTAVDVTTG